MKHPIICPKGKKVFHTSMELNACHCKHPHKMCAYFKDKGRRSYIDYLTGGYYVIHNQKRNVSSAPLFLDCSR